MEEQQTEPAPSTAGAGHKGRQEEPIDLIAQLVHELYPQRARFTGVALPSRIERDLGIDSLGRTELILRIERAFRVRLRVRSMEAERPRICLKTGGGGPWAGMPGGQDSRAP